MSKSREKESILLDEASIGQLLDVLQKRWKQEFYRIQTNQTWLPLVIKLVEQNRIDELRKALPSLNNLLKDM